MNAQGGLPSNVVIRDLLLALWFSRRRFLLTALSAMTIAAYAASQVERVYRVRSTLLVLLGSEHTLRPAAGQQLVNSFSVEPEQVLRTEAAILASSDLHRTVIEEIGVANLYPDLLKPPGKLAQFVQRTRAYVADAFGQNNGEIDPVLSAERKFAEHLGITVDKQSHIVEIIFEHTNPLLSSQALKLLETRYFELRGKLFADRQVSIVQAEANRTIAELAAAEARLDDYKHSHDIANFAERQTILITQQGSLEDQLAKNESARAGLQARIVELSQLIKLVSGVSGNYKGASSGAGPLQALVDVQQRRQQEALPARIGTHNYDSARFEMLKIEGEIARIRAEQASAVQQEINKAQADMHAYLGSSDAIKAQLREISKQLASLNVDQIQLHSLERSRNVIEDSYKAIEKIVTDRRVMEDVDANRQSSVRVIEEPRVPDRPQATRRLILIAGAIFALGAGAIVTLMSSFFRGFYLRPEALAVDTGLAVLAVVPDQKFFTNPQVLVTPVLSRESAKLGQ
jgi:uncharacterized protein involved in exopolysaccharide biosynthesis